MIDIFDEIVSPENLKQAYLQLAHKFDFASKSSRYHGLDGSVFNDNNYTSEELLKVVAEEMKSFTPITPANCTSIPKKNGGKRDIYIYSIRERIKAEAMYRVLEPIFDKHLAPYIYSYRASHPSYFAARSVVRRYKRYFGENYIFTADISEYSISIDHEILLRKINEYNFDEKTMKLITLFVKGKVILNGRIVTPEKGFMTGTPLYGMFSNVYMNDFDSWAGKYVAFYRRVGDDIIAMDKDKSKVEFVSEKLNQTVAENKIKLNAKKIFLNDDSHPFIFLGYKFSDGKVSFDPKSLRKIYLKWKINLYRYPGGNIIRKIKHVDHLVSSKTSNLDNEFNQLVKQKMLVDDQDQVRQFSEKFYELLTKYTFGVYSAKNRREFIKLTRDTKIDSLFSHYYKIHFPESYGEN